MPWRSAEQFVRKRYPVELAAMRRRHSQSVLIVVLDGDGEGVRRRRGALAAVCREAGVDDRTASEPVVVLVPTWNIETWLAYAAGEIVDENRPDYPRLARESECQPQVEALAAMCERRRLRKPAPPSLEDACNEYERLFGRMGR